MKTDTRFRLAVALVIFASLFFVVGKQELLDVLASLRPIYLIHLAFLSFLLIWISCVKWRLFLRAGGSDASLAHLMKLYTIGYFVNLVSPSFIGGDIVRSYQLGAHVGSQRDAFVSTFLERFTGLLAMTTLALVFVLAGAEVAKGLEAAVYVAALGSFALAAICFSKRIGDLFFGIAAKVSQLILAPAGADRVRALLGKLATAFDFARGDYSLLGQSLALSFGYHLLTILNTYVAARAVGWESPSIAGLFIVVPLVLIVSMVPITPSGLGIQEGAFLFLLQRIGATRGQAFGVGLILRAKVLVLGILGGLLWLAMRPKKERNNVCETSRG